MAKERAIELQLIKPIQPGSPGSKGKITLRNLFKEYFNQLNVSYDDPCCTDDSNAGACPAISEDADNIIECREDGLYAAAAVVPEIEATNGLSVSAGAVQLGELAFSGSGDAAFTNDRELPLGNFDLYLTSADGSAFSFATYPNSEMQMYSYAGAAGTKMSIVLTNFAGSEVQFYKEASSIGNRTFLVNTTGHDFIIGDVGSVGTTADIIFRAAGVDRFTIDGNASFVFRNLTVTTATLTAAGSLSTLQGFTAPGSFGYGFNGSPAGVFGVHGDASGNVNINANAGNIYFNSFGTATGDFARFDGGDYSFNIFYRISTDNGGPLWGLGAVTTAASTLDTTRYVNVTIAGTPVKLAVIA